MGTVNLIAKSDFPYNGRSWMPGDLFEAVSEQDANTLRLLGKADDAPRLRKTSRKDLTSDPDTVSLDRPKRQYRRRDLVAEP